MRRNTCSLLSAAVFTSARVVTTTCLKTHIYTLHTQIYTPTHTQNKQKQYQIIMVTFGTQHQDTIIVIYIYILYSSTSLLFYFPPVVFEPYRALGAPLQKNVFTLPLLKGSAFKTFAKGNQQDLCKKAPFQ